MNDIVLNKAMKKLLNRAAFFSKKMQADKIESIISANMLRLKHYSEGDQYWIVMDNRKVTLTDIERVYSDLVGYEWTCNEIYIEAKFFKRNYRETILIMLTKMKDFLSQQYPNESFFIGISAQQGQYANIKAHFHLFRKNQFYLDLNIENYTQPTLYEIFTPSM